MKTYIIGIISLWSLNEQSKCDSGAVYLSMSTLLIINKGIWYKIAISYW